MTTLFVIVVVTRCILAALASLFWICDGKYPRDDEFTADDDRISFVSNLAFAAWGCWLVFA